MAELENIQQRIIQITREVGLPFSSGINLQENHVELFVTDQALWETSLRQKNIQLPAHVQVIVAFEPLGNNIPFPLTPPADVVLPQLRVRSSAFMAALIEGTLAVQDGCLRVTGADVPTGALVIWQPDYFVNDNQGKIELLNREGQVVARVGERISLSGGEVAMTPEFEKQLRAPIPKQCQGPYWLMGQIVGAKGN